MRTTINLDAETYSFTRTYAEANGVSLSAAIGTLLRHARQNPPTGSESPRLKTSPHGYLVIAPTGHPLTPAMVREASEDELA